MQSVSTVQNTISKPRLFMIFYWQKFFYLKNIQRSFLVRCRLGKLAFFNNASLATLAIILQNITAQRCSACHDGNPHAHNLINHCRHCDLVLYLTAHNLCILCELTAHTVCCNMLYFITQITVWQLLKLINNQCDKMLSKGCNLAGLWYNYKRAIARPQRQQHLGTFTN